MTLWEIITTVALLIACAMTPYGLAFDADVSNSEGDPPPQKDFFECTSLGTCTELTADLIFMLEIFVTINTALLDAITNKYIISRSTIFCTYFKSWFAVDLVAVLPRFFRLIKIGDGSSNQMLGLLKFARVSRIFKLVRLGKLIKASQ